MYYSDSLKKKSHQSGLGKRKGREVGGWQEILMGDQEDWESKRNFLVSKITVDISKEYKWVIRGKYYYRSEVEQCLTVLEILSPTYAAPLSY